MSAHPRWARRQERRFGVRRNARGTALMEFALVFPFLLVLTLSVIDLSRAFFIKNILYQAAREGARVLVVSAAADTSNVRARVNLVTSAAGVGIKSWSITGPSDGMMTVRIESEFKWLFPGLFQWMGAQYANPVKLVGRATMRREGV